MAWLSSNWSRAPRSTQALHTVAGFIFFMVTIQAECLYFKHFWRTRFKVQLIKKGKIKTNQLFLSDFCSNILQLQAPFSRRGLRNHVFSVSFQNRFHLIGNKLLTVWVHFYLERVKLAPCFIQAHITELDVDFLIANVGPTSAFRFLLFRNHLYTRESSTCNWNWRVDFAWRRSFSHCYLVRKKGSKQFF